MRAARAEGATCDGHGGTPITDPQNIIEIACISSVSPFCPAASGQSTVGQGGLSRVDCGGPPAAARNVIESIGARQILTAQSTHSRFGVTIIFHPNRVTLIPTPAPQVRGAGGFPSERKSRQGPPTPAALRFRAGKRNANGVSPFSWCSPLCIQSPARVRLREAPAALGAWDFFLWTGSALILALCDFWHARPLYHRTDGSMAERDLTAREDRFIGFCLGGRCDHPAFCFHPVVLVGRAPNVASRRHQCV